MDKVEKIKEKVEELRQSCYGVNNDFAIGQKMALTKILSFIDSLEEDELTKDEQKVSNTYCRKIRDKRVLPILKGESKHKFINEFNTLYQTLDMQLCDRCMKEPLKDLCLAFATWGAYNLKHIGGISKEEITKMDSLQEEPVSEDLEEAAKKAATQTVGGVEKFFWNDYHKFKAGAEWQKVQDQETIELAEDHAMLAGIIKGTEHTIGNVRSILNKVAYKNNGLDVNGDYCEQPYVELDAEFRKLLKEE